MTVNYITGSSENKNTGAVAGLSVNSTLVNAVNANQSSSTGRHAGSLGRDLTTITTSAGGTVENIISTSDSYAFRLSSLTNAAAGKTINIVGADDPITGVHYIVEMSGSYAVTNTPYTVCATIAASGTYTFSGGTVDTTANHSFIKEYTSSVNGSSTQALFGGTKPPNRKSVNEFVGYYSRTYTVGWAAFTGTINECYVANSGVTFNSDDAATGNPTVIMDTGMNVQAADLDPPDTTGLRSPA